MSKAQQKPEKFNNLINGQWIESEDYATNVNPSNTQDVIGLYARATEADCQSAIQAASDALHDWSHYGPEQKQAILNKIGDELIERKEEIGTILSREEGKPIAEGMGEVARSGQFFHYYAAECLRQMGELAESVRPGVEVEVRREPVGVIGVITPWNFPIAIAAWKIAPALAYGNTVVLKPADKTPASAWLLADIFHRSGLPAGVVNLVMGRGSVIGNAISTSSNIDAISFTGSVPVGRQIARNAIDNMVKVQLEMGSKNALVVLADADLELAVQCAVNGAFFGSGQKCTASSRLIVEASIHDEFVSRMKTAIEQLKVGNGQDQGTQIGPVVDEQQYNTALKYIDMAHDCGAELVVGGSALSMETEGYYIAPTLFTNTTNDMPINREEMFAPIACVIKADDYDHALALCNDTEFGLTAGIITQSLKYATHFKQHAQSGCVMVNLPTAGTDYHVPFGGRKNSSFGPREQGQYAKEFYSIVKTSYVKAY